MYLNKDELNKLYRKKDCVSVLTKQDFPVMYAISGDENYNNGLKPKTLEIIQQMLPCNTIQADRTDSIAYIVKGDHAIDKFNYICKTLKDEVASSQNPYKGIDLGEWNCAERKIIGKILPINTSDKKIVDYINHLKDSYVDLCIYSTKIFCFKCKPFIFNGIYLDATERKLFEYKSKNHKYDKINNEFSFDYYLKKID